MTIGEALKRAAGKLDESGESPRIEAEVLLARALDVPRAYLYGHPEDELDDAAAERFFDAVGRRADGVPLAYLTGTREFWSLELMVGPETLVPRPEPELLVELALAHLPAGNGGRVLDLGTGSGAIALAIASERPGCRVVAVDCSPGALAVARENARQLELPNIDFLAGDWTQPVAGSRFDVVVSNPPYVAAGDPALHALRHEPAAALVSGADGLDAIRLLARDCRPLVAPDGVLLLEHGAGQEDAAMAILADQGWTGLESRRDLAFIPRAVIAHPAAGGA